MKCVVCNRNYDADLCPRCKFPNVQILGSYEEGLNQLRPTIDAHRGQFFSTVEVGLLIHYWHDDGGTLVSDRQERLSFGRVSELLGKTVWLEQSFARIPDVKELTLTVYVDYRTEDRVETVTLPNLLNPSLQQVGIRMGDGDAPDFRILLRSGSEKPVSSERIVLLN